MGASRVLVHVVNESGCRAPLHPPAEAILPVLHRPLVFVRFNLSGAAIGHGSKGHPPSAPLRLLATVLVGVHERHVALVQARGAVENERIDRWKEARCPDEEDASKGWRKAVRERLERFGEKENPAKRAARVRTKSHHGE